MTSVEALASYEQVLVGNDPTVGLRAIVAIHSTALGPALGGTRFVAYADEEAALADVDLLSPCALGGIITADVVPALQAAAVCGGANNQLADEGLADVLARRGVVYAPDFLVNAGGVIAVGAEYAGRGTYDDDAARERARAIGTTLLDVLRRAEAGATTPLAAAERLAEERIAAAPPRPSFAPLGA